MKIYVVFRNGVYRHECGGIFSTFELAKSAAKCLLEGEPDDYHYYDIVMFELDMQTTHMQTSVIDYGELAESKPICTLTRNDGIIIEYEN